jgi:hypothetical protein
MASSNPMRIPKRKLGVTPVRSFDGPLEADLQSTAELEQVRIDLLLWFDY